jgi:hypothetical protein
MATEEKLGRVHHLSKTVDRFKKETASRLSAPQPNERSIQQIQRGTQAELSKQRFIVALPFSVASA